ncbi:hypothetical protein niasHS_017018 [Heterodera schachtii]|uniref:Uncharacterized protein n=1 Tax=Heterodera schachtii TaxID=97005 RepID=A0ABD2ICK0_HETSC
MFTFWPVRLSLPDGLQNCCSHCQLPISSSLPQGINDHYGEQQQRKVPTEQNAKNISSKRQKRHTKHSQIRHTLQSVQLIPRMKCSVGTQTEKSDGNFADAKDEAKLAELCTELAIRLLNIADRWEAKLETEQKQQQTNMALTIFKWIFTTK